MFIVVTGRIVDVGERRVLEGLQLMALAGVGPDGVLRQVVRDPGARYLSARYPTLSVHDERVRDSGMVHVASNALRPRRFFTLPRGLSGSTAGVRRQ